MDVNDNPPPVVHVDVNDKADSRSRGRKRVVHVDVNEHGTPSGYVPPPPFAYAQELVERAVAGESVDELRRECEGRGYQFNVRIPKGD